MSEIKFRATGLKAVAIVAVFTWLTVCGLIYTVNFIAKVMAALGHPI